MLVIKVLKEALFGGYSHSHHQRNQRQIWALTVFGLLAVAGGIIAVSAYKTDEARHLVAIDHPILTDRREPFSGTHTRSEKLHFFIAGFPKCGTTTLLYIFARHKETEIGRQEKCAIANPSITDASATARVGEGLSELSSSPGVKKGIKCPSGIKNIRTLERIQSYAPNTRLIIGVRHPVEWLASFYNYRITEIYDRGLNETIPPIESLQGTKEWKGVSTDFARFELYLMQLGKTQLFPQDLVELVERPHMGIRPNSLKIFLYSVEQLEGGNTQRAFAFRRDLANFLDLREPIEAFGHENLNHFVGKNAHRETVNICDAKYADLRASLVLQGRKTALWIKNRFMKSDDVFISNSQYFSSQMNKWGRDPCLF